VLIRINTEAVTSHHHAAPRSGTAVDCDRACTGASSVMLTGGA
jgi:hypothetical protein